MLKATRTVSIIAMCLGGFAFLLMIGFVTVCYLRRPLPYQIAISALHTYILPFLGLVMICIGCFHQSTACDIIGAILIMMTSNLTSVLFSTMLARYNFLNVIYNGQIFGVQYMAIIAALMNFVSALFTFATYMGILACGADICRKKLFKKPVVRHGE